MWYQRVDPMLLKKIVIAEDDDAIAHMVNMSLGDAGNTEAWSVMQPRASARCAAAVRVVAAMQ